MLIDLLIVLTVLAVGRLLYAWGARSANFLYFKEGYKYGYKVGYERATQNTDAEFLKSMKVKA